MVEKGDYESSQVHRKYGKAMYHLPPEEASAFGPNITKKAKKVAGDDWDTSLFYARDTSILYAHTEGDTFIPLGKASKELMGQIKSFAGEHEKKKGYDEVAARRVERGKKKTGGLEEKTRDVAEMASMTAGVVGLIMLGVSASGMTGNIIGGRARDYLISLELVLVVIGILGLWSYLSNKEKKK